MTDFRAPRKVLRMVQELHVLGYQRVRIAPYMAPSGMAWRCAITTREHTLRTHGAIMALGAPCASYTSAGGRDYFGWKDLAHPRPIDLAKAFIERLPDLAAAGKGEDWEYAGWYVWMMHLTHPDGFPYAFADYDVPTDYIPTTEEKKARVPLPPAGKADDIAAQ